MGEILVWDDHLHNKARTAREKNMKTSINQKISKLVNKISKFFLHYLFNSIYYLKLRCTLIFIVTQIDVQINPVGWFNAFILRRIRILKCSL